MELLIHAYGPRAGKRGRTRRQRRFLVGRRFLAPPLATCLLVALTLFLCPAVAQSPPSEYEVKAAFLLNFTRFVEWPADAFADANAPFTICILGADPFGNTMDRMVAGEAVNHRRLVVRRISDAPSPRTCQVLFVGSVEADLPKTLKQAGPGVLTVGEGDRFIADGGMIRFVVENRRVHFDISRTAASAARLKLSSQLLKVARSVR
jgi:YfiR/HmsC-like